MDRSLRRQARALLLALFAAPLLLASVFLWVPLRPLGFPFSMAAEADL